MIGKEKLIRIVLAILATVVIGVWLRPPPVKAQEEVASSLRRYRDREVSTGYYEEYEVLPGRARPLIGSLQAGVIRRGGLGYTSTAAMVRTRRRMADSHQGLQFYQVQSCVKCHPSQALDIHTVRANLTCRQCHGGEPIAGLSHYYSLMNPIRRHAYVCAKCHEGASASFATYVVHEADPGSDETKRTFPSLYYAHWFMLILLIVTLAFFLPHSLLTGLRELFRSRRREEEEADDAD